MEQIPLPIAIALIVTSTGFAFFLVKSFIAAKERDAKELDSRFDDVYRHIDRVEETLDRRVSDEYAAIWRNLDDANERFARLERKTK